MSILVAMDGVQLVKELQGATESTIAIDSATFAEQPVSNKKNTNKRKGEKWADAVRDA